LSSWAFKIKILNLSHIIKPGLQGGNLSHD